MTGRRVVILLAAAFAVILVGVAVVSLWVPATPSPYRLPWAAGEQNRQTVMQGNFAAIGDANCTSGCGTHDVDAMRYAWDFDLPEGTEVIAARGGTVALTNGSWRPDHCGGVSTSEDGLVSGLIGNETNFVQIDHGDGTSALYLHLSTVAPEIERKAKTAEPVVQGEVLGLSGKTGYTRCVPHLHFQVENTVKADWFTTSLPITFADPDVLAQNRAGVPVEGQSYLSGNVPVKDK